MQWQWDNLDRNDLINVIYKLIIKNSYIPITPTNKQLEFLSLFNKEVLYGGAAGGGKSAALLAAALMFVEYPKYKALLLRRTYSQLNLPGALMDLAAEWLDDTAAKWNGQEKQWVFPSGATLNFGYLDTEKDKFRYQGAEFHFVGVDELTQFNESQYLYLFSRIRRPKDVSVPLRFRSASNPGGIGHEWVKGRFLSCVGNDRLFIPARLYDNPHLDQESYAKNLQELDPVTRRQLQDGDWDVITEGNYFKRVNFKKVEILPNRGQVVRFWDLAATEAKEGNDPDYTVGVKMRHLSGQYYIEDVVRGRYNPNALEAVIRDTAEKDGKDISIYMEQEPGSSGKIVIDHYAKNVLNGYAFRGVRNTGSKISRANPFSAAVENGNVFLLNGEWNKDFVNELIVFPQKGFHDDQVDAASGAFDKINNKGKVIIESKKINRVSRTIEGY